MSPIQKACSTCSSKTVDLLWYFGLGSAADYDRCLDSVETCNTYTNHRFYSLKNSLLDPTEKILISNANAYKDLKKGRFNLYELYHILLKNEK